MKVDRGVLDTSVLVEYLGEEPTRGIDELFRRIGRGEFKAYLTHVTIAEVVYVAYRIYREAGASNPNEKALKYVDWLINLPGTEIIRLDAGIAKVAGELKKSFRLALSDVFVIASAVTLGYPAIFLKLESEMEPYREKLEDLGVIFWEEVHSQHESGNGHSTS